MKLIWWWAYLPERIAQWCGVRYFEDKPKKVVPDFAYRCDLFWRSILGVPFSMIVLCFAMAVFFSVRWFVYFPIKIVVTGCRETFGPMNCKIPNPVKGAEGAIERAKQRWCRMVENPLVTHRPSTDEIITKARIEGAAKR